MFRRRCDTLVHLEFFRLEDLPILEIWELIFLLLVPVENLEPIQLLDTDTLGVEPFTTHFYFDLGFCQLSIFTDCSEEVPC